MKKALILVSMALLVCCGVLVVFMFARAAIGGAVIVEVVPPTPTRHVPSPTLAPMTGPSLTPTLTRPKTSTPAADLLALEMFIDAYQAVLSTPYELGSPLWCDVARLEVERMRAAYDEFLAADAPEGLEENHATWLDIMANSSEGLENIIIGYEEGNGEALYRGGRLLERAGQLMNDMQR